MLINTPRGRVRCRPLSAAVAVVAMVAGCGGQQQAGPPAARRPPAASTLGQSLSTIKTEWSGVTVEIVDITRTAGTFLLRFRVTNGSARPFELGDRFAGDPGDRDSVAGLSLLEPSGLRKYYVLRDRDNRPLCSTALSPLAPGETRLLFARFPAPVEGTSRITIQIPHAAEMREVPVTTR